MNKLVGGLFFVSAGILLAFTKLPDIYTVAAVAACAVIAALTVTRYAVWSVVGGLMLISVSFVLQTALTYRCTDCIKADLLIMAGVIYLSIIESGEMKRVIRGMAGVITAMLMVNAWLHYPVYTILPQAVQADKVGQFISANLGGKEINLDTSAKPVLLYSPSCGACRSTIEKLAETDPGGKGWVPVQVGGDPEEGRVLLDSTGYRESMYQSEKGWDEAVPALVTTMNGKTKVVYGQEAILGAVRGDSG